MESDEGGLRYSDHLYFDYSTSDGEESEDELSSRFGHAYERAHTDEANLSGRPTEPGGPRTESANHTDSAQRTETGEMRTSPGREPDKVTSPDVAVDGTEFVSNTGTTQLNRKDFEDLTMDDMKAVYFPTVEEAEKFYRLYSRTIGFGIRRGRREMEGDELIVRRQWVCSKEGMSMIKPRKEKGVEKDRTPKKQNIGDAKKSRRNMIPRGRRYTRVNCPAAFNVRYCKDSQLYKVTSFVREHNHDLAMAHELQFLRANRKVEERAVKQVENLRRAQIYTSAAYEHLVEQAGGHEFVGFLAKDLYNILDRKRRKEQVDGDAQAALTWMNMRGMESGQFWCKYITDEEGRLTNLFWRDEQSLLDYSAYGDVLVMDSTYKTNLYGKPLVVFVGCNNHRATVVFGFAVICDEKEDTYTWVFRKFLESMNYKQPVSVLTDGDESVRNVVVRLMSGARHRLCAWHIGRNIGQNVKDDAAQKLIGKMIYSSMSVGEWEAAWHSMVARHGLSDNAWVASLYNKRERWAEAFFRGHFFGGMCSTQRVEGMHSKLKKQIGRYTRLCEVMPRMERTLGRIRNRVLYDNFLSKNSAPLYETHMRGIEEDACMLFTHDIFVMIKSQIMFERKFVMEREVAFNISDFLMFYLRQYDRPERKWCVEFRSDPANPKWLCFCKLFESDGIPCGHIFNILKYQLVSRYPKSLISRRWTKAVSETTFAPRLKGRTDDKSAKVARYSALISEASKACQNYAFSDEGFKVGMTEIARLAETSSEFRVDLPTDTSHVPPSSNVVRDPTVSRTKGMPSNPCTNTENGTSGQRVCGLCFMPGHNQRTCPGRDEVAPAREDVPATGSVLHPADSVNQSTHSVPDPASSVPHPARCVPQPYNSFPQPAPLVEGHFPLEADTDGNGGSQMCDFAEFPPFFASQQSSSLGAPHLALNPQQSSSVRIPPVFFNLNQIAADEGGTVMNFIDGSYPPTK